MRPRLTFQRRVLLLVAGVTTLVLLLSAYLHGLITRSLIEDDRYHKAVGQTVSIAERIAARKLFTQRDELRRDITLVAGARSGFKQIDVYQTTSDGPVLAATSAPAAARLTPLDGLSRDNDLGEMERPLSDVVTMEVLRDSGRYWLISAALRGRDGSGYVTALVLKNPYNPLVSRLEIQHNLVLAGAMATGVALLSLLFARTFRRPARDIVQAMARLRAGDLAARAEVCRDDELGEIARGFNLMVDDLSARDRERDALLTTISGFNRDLHAKVASATRELREANEALLQSQQRLARSQRLAAIGQVTASLAHEIGTPLNSIRGHLQLLAREHPHDADTQRRVAIVDKQLDYIVGIVRTLLQRTRMRRPPMGPTDLNELIRELLRLVRPTLDANAIGVSTTLDPAVPLVLAVPDSLHQVFLNLINNSIDAMPAGGRLDIQTGVDYQARVAEVRVHDTGSGIAPEALDHLFEPLWTSKATGSGFGLAIAREIVNEHGGEIDVVRHDGEGAVFRLRLPWADAAVAARGAQR